MESLRSLHTVFRQSGAAGRDQIDGNISDIAQICIYEISDKDQGANASLAWITGLGSVVQGFRKRRRGLTPLGSFGSLSLLCSKTSERIK